MTAGRISAVTPDATAGKANYGMRILCKLKAVTCDVWILLLLIAVFNLHLLGVPVKSIQVFYPSAVAAGEWWRLVTHPFVHVSWYHLMLDAGAFFLLYAGLRESRIYQRLLALVPCAGLSLLAAVCFVKDIDSVGLCGLSGTAHGLMALTGLEMMQMKKSHLVPGILSFLAVTLKSIVEFIDGQVLFDFMHMGQCGTPLAACHLGGVVGGICAFILLNLNPGADRSEPGDSIPGQVHPRVP